MRKLEYKQELPTKPGIYWNTSCPGKGEDYIVKFSQYAGGLADHCARPPWSPKFGLFWAGPIEPPDPAEQPDRPEHIACIAHSHKDKLSSAWCGRHTTHEWTFTTIDHAAYTIKQKGRLVPCPQCLAEIQKLLQPPEEAAKD